MDFTTLFANKMVGFGIIGLAGGFISGKTKKAKNRNAMIGAAAGAGIGAFLNMRDEDAASLEGWGAPANIGMELGPAMISGSNGGSSIPYVSADAGPTGSRRPRRGTYAYRRARADAGMGAIMPARGTRRYRHIKNPLLPYTPVRPAMAPYRPVRPAMAPYRPIVPRTANYRPVPGHHRSYYHRPGASIRVKQYCAQLKQAIDAVETRMANNQPIHAYPNGPALAPDQARNKLHRMKQVYAHWCSML